MNYQNNVLGLLVLLLSGLSYPLQASQEVVIDQDEPIEQWYAPVSRADLLALTDEDPHVRKVAQMIIERVYEQEPKPLINSKGKNDYGSTFPLYPEVAAQFMKSASGITVLELGAGYGENALLFALAGAQQVYINDIDAENFIPLIKDMMMLPQEYRKHIRALKGDCFGLMDNKELQQACDLIIARNIIHFFDAEKRDQLFTMIARLLKPGGQVVISMNAPFKWIPNELIEQHPDASVFLKVMPMGALPNQSRSPIFGMGEFSVPTTTTPVDPLKFNFAPLVTFNRDGIKKHPSLALFSKDWQEAILAYAESLIEQKGIEKLISNGACLDCHTSYQLLYTKRTVPSLLNNTPLRLAQALYTKYSGHTTQHEGEAAGLTLVLKKEIEKACFTCGQRAMHLCSQCKNAYFCGKECQVAGWKQHRKECASNLGTQ